MLKSTFQLFIEKLVQSALTLLKVVLLSKWLLKRSLPDKKHPNCIVLGNGPSLKRDLDTYPEFLENKDLFGVNFFWKTDLFTRLKPRYYVIQSESYWLNEGKKDFNAKGRKMTFDGLVEKTQWSMTLFVPSFSKKFKKWQQTIAQNKNIRISFYNATPAEGFDSLNIWLMKKNLAMPRPHNVLIPSVKIAVDLGYKHIYLLGADHTWLKDLFVADNNEVYLTQKHFYNEKQARPEVMYQGQTTKVRNLPQVLMKFVYAFNSYFELKKYAKKKNSHILNATKGSFIDAFDRYSLENKKIVPESVH